MFYGSIPLDSHNLTPLAEDLRLLNLMPGSAKPISESKDDKGKKADKDDEGYNYGDKLKDDKDKKESEASDADPVEEDEETVDPVEEDEESDEEVTEAQLEKAFRVLEHFDAMSEDDVDELSEEQLDLVETAHHLLEKRRKKMSAASYQKWKKSMRTQTGAEKKANRKAAKARKLDVSGKRKRARQEKLKTGGRSESNDEVDSILERLKSLGSTTEVQESDEVGVLSDKIVEGFKGVFKSADEIANRIATELGESEDVSNDDPRFQCGEYFHGIAEDAKGILNAIFAEDSEIELSDAVEDLQGLTRDLKKGIAQMEKVA